MKRSIGALCLAMICAGPPALCAQELSGGVSAMTEASSFAIGMIGQFVFAAILKLPSWNGSMSSSSSFLFLLIRFLQIHAVLRLSGRKILRFLARNVLSVRMARQLVDILAVHHVLQILAVLVLL